VSAGTLCDKARELHWVAGLPGGATQLFIGLHLIHAVASSQSFSALENLALAVTGIAGPDGGSSEGVWFGASRGHSWMQTLTAAVALNRLRLRLQAA
jgi:hypothetical protein